MRKTFLSFASPQLEDDEINEVIDSLKSGWLTRGPKVTKFEEDFKNYVHAGFACAVNSCTAALHLSLVVAGIKNGDEVITTPFTFAATASTIIHAGAMPIFVDVDPLTMNIDPLKIEEKITKRTRAIIPVHFAGRPCDMDAIRTIAKKHNLIVIEDAAHATGAQYHGKMVGSISDFTAFSFYVTKNLITGEGGMVTTNHKEYAEKISTYSLHGMSQDAWKRYAEFNPKYYEIVYPGFKYNMMDTQAALGLHQLKKQEKFLLRREEIWKKYNEAFLGLPFETPSEAEPNTRHARHLYTIVLDTEKLGFTRDEFQMKMHAKNIGTSVHFISLHLHPYYREKFGFQRDDFLNAAMLSERIVSLPLTPKLSDQDVEDVLAAVREIINEIR